MDSNKALPEGLSQEKIDSYKKEYGRVFLYTAGDGKWCILKSPSLKIIDACRSISGGSSIKFDQALLTNCWLDGNEELKTQDKYQMGLFDHLGKIFDVVAGTLGEL